MQYELITVKDGKTVGRGRDNACPKFPELCSLPAGGKYSIKIFVYNLYFLDL